MGVGPNKAWDSTRRRTSNASMHSLSCSTLVAPMMVLVTKFRECAHASAICVGLRPCRCATATYWATASRASERLYLRQPGVPSECLAQTFGVAATVLRP